jgi:2-keto-4-pentenoate hydratase/2-oxohepta-3-ene-1,7-dioic acid hydratase in catechol pathway
MANVYFRSEGRSVTVHTIFCVGRNYVEHANELNNPVPTSPIIFLKPATTLIYDGQNVELPPLSNNVHYEVEVVALIGKSGKHIPKESALEYVSGYGIGIDITARDLQNKAKQKAHPWAIAKGFDTFAPIGSFVEAGQIPDPQNMEFQLEINGNVRQVGNTGAMLFPLSKLISFLSSIFTLTPGDLIFTGTPQGVGQLHEGDDLKATLGDNLTTLNVQVKRG